MAVLQKLPSAAIIAGMKGTIDYYDWMGIHVARAWPRSPGKERAPAVQSQWSDFSFAAKEWQSLSQRVRDAFYTMGQGGGLCSRDVQMRAFLSGTFRDSIP